MPSFICTWNNVWKEQSFSNQETKKLIPTLISKARQKSVLWSFPSEIKWCKLRLYNNYEFQRDTYRKVEHALHNYSVWTYKICKAKTPGKTVSGSFCINLQGTNWFFCHIFGCILHARTARNPVVTLLLRHLTGTFYTPVASFILEIHKAITNNIVVK